MIAQYEAPDKPAELFSPRLYGTGLRHKHLTEMQKVAGLEQPPVFCPVVDDYYKGMATTIQLHNRYLRGQPTAGDLPHPGGLLRRPAPGLGALGRGCPHPPRQRSGGHRPAGAGGVRPRGADHRHRPLR